MISLFAGLATLVNWSRCPESNRVGQLGRLEHNQSATPALILVEAARLKLATLGLEGRCSIQLSYAP